MDKFIHLLYVPTMNCNMQCTYCYLGDQTRELQCDHGVVETLRFAVDKLAKSNVIPFNISLHGGEVTTLSREDFRSVIDYIHNYYRENRSFLQHSGFKVGRPHIKTNLFGLDRHMDTIRDYQVSISGSLDLPLSMHRQCRVTKGGGDTLEKILSNIALLKDLPNQKKVSATIFREHFERLDEMIRDIRYLADNTCLDMNDFNFMVGFGDGAMTPMSQQEQVELFEKMQEAFTGTDLQPGLDGAWFAEFNRGYCSNCDLCGERFFLLERNGDIYSCVRGQGDPDFYYGNIYRDSVEDILRKGITQSFLAHKRVGFHEDCAQCKYLHLCRTGCPYVKNVYHSPKSYTCLLQQRIYEKNGEAPAGAEYPLVYLERVHPQLAQAYASSLPPAENSLPWLIQRDQKLQQVYDPESFVLQLDGTEFPLHSQLLKHNRDVLFLQDTSELVLYVRQDCLEALADYPINNALYMMLLSGEMVVYGDEQREKQMHVMTHQIFQGMLEKWDSDRPGYYRVELMPILLPYLKTLPQDSPANLFFTTTALRDYHYQKQKNNGFYHMAALNLPFQNIEFYYIDREAIFYDQTPEL